VKNKKRKWFSIELIAAFIMLLLFAVYLNKGGIQSMIGSMDSTENKKHYVAVIAKSTESAYWKSVFAGANAAKTEYNLEITQEGPADEEDWETQNEMIDRAVENGAEVIVFSAVDYNNNAAAVNRAVQAGVKVVVIDSDVNSGMVSCRISTDNYQAGRMAGAAVSGSADEAVCVGIVNFDAISANGQQREQGFRDEVEADDRMAIVDAIHVNSNTECAKEATKKMLQEHPEINVIVTFNEWTSLGVGYAIRELELGEKTRVIAFDSNVVSVGMLETGEVDALIVQNPYAMGYLGIECAYRLINGQSLEQTKIDTTATVVTRENMYDSAIQRILFVFD